MAVAEEALTESFLPAAGVHDWSNDVMSLKLFCFFIFEHERTIREIPNSSAKTECETQPVVRDDAHTGSVLF